MKDTRSIGEVLRPLITRVPFERQPLLIAIAERMAAARYREWAALVDDGDRAELLRCADREEEIARRVEALTPDAASVQQALHADFPDLAQVSRSLFEGLPLERQLAVQADGERLGAATWRAFAERASDASARDTFLTCAELEEASAVVLEAFLARDAGRRP